MEKRRIQKTGGSSFTITLPKRWIEQNGLRERDVVSASPRSNGVLVVVPEKTAAAMMQVRIDLDVLSSERFKRDVIAAYIAGANLIEIVGSGLTQEHRMEARKAVQVLTGMEVVEESSGTIILKNILEEAKFPYVESTRKIFPMTRCMFEDAMKAYATSDRNLAKDVVARDFDINKAYFLIARLRGSLIADRIGEKHVGVTTARAMYMARIAYQLERIADHAAKIARLTINERKSPRPAFRKSLMGVAGRIMPIISSELFLDGNEETEGLHDALDLLRNLESDIMSLFARAAKGGVTSEIIAADSIDRLRGYVENMAEIGLEDRIM